MSDTSKFWSISHRFDPEVVPLADRHYNRQTIGAPQFAPPGRCMVLKTRTLDAFWITSWPFAEYVKHAWAGAWVCSAFRNEGATLSSELILDAVSCTLSTYGAAPSLGMITFVDTKKVRRKRDFGRCYRRAGFIDAGFTKGGLVALQLMPDAMPSPLHPIGTTVSMLWPTSPSFASTKKPSATKTAWSRGASCSASSTAWASAARSSGAASSTA